MKYWQCPTCNAKITVAPFMIMTDHEVINAHHRYTMSLNSQRCSYPTVLPLTWREETNPEDDVINNIGQI